MADHLNRHLWQNLAHLEQATYTDPVTGKTQRLKDIGGAVWLKVLGQICNMAGESDREFFAGTRKLAEAAGTTPQAAEFYAGVLEQLGWITPNGVRPPATGMRGRPARCWVVTLPGLPPLVQNLWRDPTAKKPDATAPVVPITEHAQRKPRTTGSTAALGAVVGNLAADLAHDSTGAVGVPDQPQQPVWCPEVQQVMTDALAVVRAKAASQQHTDLQLAVLAETTQSRWEARYGKHLSALDQVQAALQQGQCTSADAVRYLAAGHAGHTKPLQEFLGE
jgi:hypothetical protein